MDARRCGLQPADRQVVGRGADVVYQGGYAPVAGLLIRRAPDAGDAGQPRWVSSEDFWLVAGPTGAGTVMGAVRVPRVRETAGGRM
jgi:hypothetical protein